MLYIIVYLVWLVGTFFVSAIVNAIFMNFSFNVNVDTVLFLWFILSLLPFVIFKKYLKSKLKKS